MPHPQDGIEERRTARRELSKLFLDAELGEPELRALRDELRATGLSLDVLETIYFDELAPVLHSNLSMPAGVWTGFDSEWLEAEVKRSLNARLLERLPGVRRMRRYLTTRSTLEDWRKLRQLLES